MILFHNIIIIIYFLLLTMLLFAHACVRRVFSTRFVFRKKEIMVRIVLPVVYYFLIDDKNSYLS